MKSAPSLLFALVIAFLIGSCNLNDNDFGKENMMQTQETEALAAIKKSYGTEEQEYGVTLFVNHHLEELDKDYWKNLTGTEKPTHQQVLEQLVMINKWESEGEITYDYSLPGGVTQYVISVHFDRHGHIQEISMES